MSSRRDSQILKATGLSHYCSEYFEIILKCNKQIYHLKIYLTFN